MRGRGTQLKHYIAVVEDDDGATYQYVTFGKRRRDAEKEVRESVAKSGARLVAIKPAVDRRDALRRRQWVAAGIATAVTVFMIAVIVIVWASFGVI
ncbi:MAG: hypothetical protein M3364_06430 [Actinomycetota bacterium]|nr:hypothetical protein [Actinomycetota bacterium]